jgi:hypothetical protein
VSVRVCVCVFCEWVCIVFECVSLCECVCGCLSLFDCVCECVCTGGVCLSVCVFVRVWVFV